MSDSIKVLLTRKYFEADIEYLTARLDPRVELVTPSAFASEELEKAVAKDVQALLGEPPKECVLHKARDLKLIQVPWTGVDRLDFDLLKKFPFTICNSHSNARAVAEYACSLLLAVVKWIPYHDRYLRAGQWCRPSNDGQGLFRPPEMLFGKTAGIIGYGAIGRNIATRLDGFGIKLHAVDAEDYAEPPEPLVEVVAKADFIIVAVPLTEQTRGLINSNVFAAMKPTSYLVNISRGEIVDEADLYQAMVDRQIAGAALDTWYQYPGPGKPAVLPSGRFPFHELDNMVLSPHRAGFAADALPHLDDAIENLNRFALGKPLINVVNLERGY